MAKVLISVIVVCFSFNLFAVQLSTNGTGQVLIFPYYTVNNGTNTLIYLINTTPEPKVVNVRFREGANNKNVMSFMVYLGAFDYWDGVLILNQSSNKTKLITQDASCTFPNFISHQGVEFVNYLYTGEFIDAYGDGDERLREGYVEVIEMGVLTGASALAVSLDSQTSQIRDCSFLENSWLNGPWQIDPSVDILPPSGGLSGNISLINVEQAYAVNVEPTILEDFSDQHLHAFLENEFPALTNGNTRSTIIDSNSNRINTNWPTGIEAVNAVLTSSLISNEYDFRIDYGGTTDWVITMPTRQYNTENKKSNTDKNKISNKGLNCLPYNLSIFDREQQSVGPFQSSLCHATNNLAFINQEDSLSNIFSSFFSTLITSPFESGRITMSFDQKKPIPNENSKIVGSPVIGFAAQRYSFVSEDGIQSYAGTFKHKGITTIESPEGSNIDSGAMYIAKNNIGQYLIYPFYTVKNGLNTLIKLVNTTNKVKALRVNFFESKNARNVLGFNLYLGPRDTWLSALIPTISTVPGFEGENTARLVTDDLSCTVPQSITERGQEFLPYDFVFDNEDQQGLNMERVQQGFIQIIEMGELIGSDAVAATSENGIPSNCSNLHANWNIGGKWLDDPTINLVAPDGTGGLYGTVEVIDIYNGINLSYDATALINHNTVLFHTQPGSEIPNLSSGNIATTLIDVDDGNTIRTTWQSPLDAVSALFMQTETINHYVLEPAIGSDTEWITMYPTKHFYVDPRHSNSVPTAPFDTMLEDSIGACNVNSLAQFDQNQLNIGPFFYNSCHSVNILDINFPGVGSAVTDLGEGEVHQARFEAGWLQRHYTGSLIGTGPNGETHEIFGKPVIGFTSQIFKSVGTEGISNYGTFHPNAGTRKLVVRTPEFKTGLWYNPNRNGHGINLEKADNNLILVWYTYLPDGSPVWYLASDVYDGNGHWTANISKYVWDNSSRTATGAIAGEVSLDFDSTTTATFSWVLNGQSGSEPFKLLASGELSPNVDYTGLWYPPSDSGWGLTEVTLNNLEISVLYFYDEQGNAVWGLGSKAENAGSTISLDIYSGFCPSCQTVATTLQPLGIIETSFTNQTTGFLTTNINKDVNLKGWSRNIDWQIDNIAIKMLSTPASKTLDQNK